MSQYRSSRDGSRAPPPVRPKPARQAEAIAASAVKWKIGVSRLGYYALSPTRSLPRCTLDCLTRDPPLLSLVDTADWPTTSCGVSKSCSKESMSDTFPLDFPGTASIAIHVDGPLLGRHPPGSERRACGGASIAKGDADPEDEDRGHQATPQASKDRRRVRYRRGEPAGSRPPAHTPTTRSTGSVKVRGEPDR